MREITAGPGSPLGKPSSPYTSDVRWIVEKSAVLSQSQNLRLLRLCLQHQWSERNGIGKSSLTISAEPDGAWAGSQLWTLKVERSGLWTRTATESVHRSR